MLKKLLITIIVLWIVVIGGYLLGAGYYKNNVVEHPFSIAAGSDEVSVESGDTLYSVLDRLSSKGILKNNYLAKYYIKSGNKTSEIKPGRYSINSEMSLDEFISVLGKGSNELNPDFVKVTIPEGFDLEAIAQRLDEKGIIKKDEFIASSKQYKLPGYIKSDAKRRYGLEGFLFPDTYEFKKGTPGSKIIETMNKRFDEVIAEIAKDKNVKINNGDLDKIITMASIVEKEIETPSERVLAASVFYNRLNKGMKLESCATVLYALGVHKDKVLDADLKVDSPYNTYLVNALPEGPICSPGKASIEAALQPAKTSFLYFVSRNDGTHEFNATFSAHLAAAQKYQGSK